MNNQYEYLIGCFYINNPKLNYTLNELYELFLKSEHHLEPFIWDRFSKETPHEKLYKYIADTFKQDNGRFFYYDKDYNFLHVYYHLIQNNKKIVYLALYSCKNFERSEEWKIYYYPFYNGKIENEY